MFAPTQRRPVVAVLALAGVSAALAACGGGGDDANKQITDTLSAGLTTTDPTVICEKTLSTGLIGRVYDTQAACITAEKKDAKDSKAASAVEVSAIKVSGDKATAFVEIKGGDQDGARGELTLVKQDGGWRVDDLSTALLRSQLKAGLASETDLDTALKTCVGDKALALDDAAFRALAYGSMGDKAAASAQLGTFVADCTTETAGSSGSSDSGSASVLRQQFEKGIEESLKRDGISTSAIDCVKRELQSAISDKQIVALIGKSSKEVPPEIASATAGALAACNATK